MAANFWKGAAFALCSLLSAHASATLPIQHWQAASGAQVYFVESHDLPILDVSVDFPAGSGFDSREKSGLAALVQRLLKLGADGLSEEEISKRVADVGAVLGGRFDPDRSGVNLRTLSSERERSQALDVMARVLQQPEFPQAALEREKVRIISGIREADTKPEYIAERAFSAMIYGDHPYGLRAPGEIDTVEALRREDVLDFYRAHYHATEAVVAIMGDVSRAQAEQIAEQLTAQLPAGGASAGIPPVAMLESGASRKISHPATQSHILVGAPGMKRDDPDYFALYVGNYILGGGGFVSRLTEEIREKRGLAYSVYSYFIPLQQPGAFQIGLQTRKDQADGALEVVRQVLREFIARGPARKELREAKQNIVNGFPLRLDSNKKIHDYLGVIGFYRLPLSYLDDFTGNVEKVTAKDIQSAFARRLDPDKMVTVILGAEDGQEKK